MKCLPRHGRFSRFLRLSVRSPAVESGVVKDVDIGQSGPKSPKNSHKGFLSYVYTRQKVGFLLGGAMHMWVAPKAP